MYAVGHTDHVQPSNDPKRLVVKSLQHSRELGSMRTCRRVLHAATPATHACWAATVGLNHPPLPVLTTGVVSAGMAYQRGPWASPRRPWCSHGRLGRRVRPCPGQQQVPCAGPAAGRAGAGGSRGWRPQQHDPEADRQL